MTDFSNDLLMLLHSDISYHETNCKVSSYSAYSTFLNFKGTNYPNKRKEITNIEIFNHLSIIVSESDSKKILKL